MSAIKARTMNKVLGNTGSFTIGSHFKDLIKTIQGFGEGSEFTLMDVADCFSKSRKGGIIFQLNELRNIRVLQEEGVCGRSKVFRVTDEAMKTDFIDKYLAFENYFSSSRNRLLACSMLDQLAEVRPGATYNDLSVALGRSRTSLYPVMRNDEVNKLDVFFNNEGTVPYFVNLNDRGFMAANDMMKLSVALQHLNRKSPMAQHLYS